MSKTQHEALAGATRDALRAPSVFNTQPWRWRIDAAMLELQADRDRQLTVADPEGRLLMLSCGMSLHHALVALTAAGWDARVQRLATTFSDQVLARVFIGEPREVKPYERALYEAIERRRTDRRPFGDQAVMAGAVRLLEAAAAGEGAHVHRVRMDQMPMLAIAVATAGAREMADPAYRDELARWVNRPSWSGDGVPADTTVRRVPRRVPVRELTLPPQEGIDIEPGGDRGAVYFVLFGDHDGPSDWLRAGEAASAVLLTAVTLGLSVAPISDVIEVEHTRNLVRGLLDGSGHPYLVLRCGLSDATGDLAEAPRREAAEVIQGLPVR